jgi:hypothetical protein
MYLYFFSLIITFYVFYIKKIGISEIIHWIFLGFMILYNIFPLIVYRYFKELNTFSGLSLAKDSYLLDNQLFVSGLVLITYSIFLLLKYHKTRFWYSKDYEIKIYTNPIHLYVILFPIALYLSFKYNWTYGPRNGFGPSLSAYLRNFIGVLAIIAFIKYKKHNFKKIVLLLSYILIGFLSTQRTNLFVVFIAFILSLNYKKNIKWVFFFLILVMGVIGITRNGVNITNFLYPFVGEGIFGSYGMLQVMKVIETKYNLSYSLIYFNDLFDKISSWFHLNINLFGVSDLMNEMKNQGIIKENYYPLGGHFFPSDSHLVLPYLGPIIQIIFFGLIIVFTISRIKDKYLKVIIYSNLFLLFKANLSVFFVFLLFQIISYYFFRFINMFFKKVKYHDIDLNI